MKFLLLVVSFLEILTILMPGKTIYYKAPEPTPIEAIVTAYTSSPDETDIDPWVTASGERVHPGTAACPIVYKFGSVIQIQGKYYICMDRMNKRYRQTNHFDIWMETKDEAFNWGRQELIILVHTK